MLAFFRKYQRYFFLAITIVIVISFSFFGTYSTLTNTSGYDQTAFTAIDGTKITKSELDQLAMFISTDAEDKLLFGGIWGPNFLNDGVIKKNFLQTGLAEILMAFYIPEIASDLTFRHEKEKKYTPYVHPQAKFVSVESSWNYLAPDIKIHYEALKASSNPLSPEAVKNRIHLFLSEKQLPAPLLKQVLQYQQQQYGWLNPDPNIQHMDFSLFGYHTVEDWFGSHFIKLTAEFIINASIMAEQKGYQVSKSEALADLLYNSEVSYKQMLNSPYLGVANSGEFFNEQLRRMQLSQSQAADIWTKVLLFRRWFNDVGSSVFVDPLVFEKFDDVANEKAIGDLYQLPQEFRIGSFRTLQQLEVYLNAISKQDDKSPLSIPEKFYSIEEVVKNTPELIQKRYILEVAQVDLSALQAKVGLKETWNWEVEDANWSLLQKKFADVGMKNAATISDRFAVLDAIDDKSRSKIDAYARKSIIESHPEWVDQALNEAAKQSVLLKLNLKGKSTLFQGLKNPEEFMKLLDAAKLGEQEDALAKYTFDGSAFYRLLVKERSPNLEIAAFAEGRESGALDELLNKKLEAYYELVKEKYPSDFHKADKTWKSYSEAKAKVAELYYGKLLSALRSQYKALHKEASDVIDDIASSLRFYNYMKSFLEIAKKDPSRLSSYLQLPNMADTAEALLPRASLENQWKLIMVPNEVERGSENADINLEEVFKMEPGTWSSVQTPANGDVTVYNLKSRESVKNLEALNRRVAMARQLLGDEAQRTLMGQVVQEIKEKGAISLGERSPEQEP